MPALLLALLLSTPAPGDGTRLAPDPGVSEPADATVPAAPVAPEPMGIPLVPLGAIAAAAAVLAGTGRLSRDGEASPADGLGLAPQPLVVFVPGHGNRPADFDDLIGLMDLEDGDYRMFDYRWAVETTDHSHASMTASIDSTADTLNAYLAGLSDGERDLYLVGFSKGGAAIAELVSRWDRGVPPPVDGVVGAAMLDPPIASGFHGVIQSLGRFVGPIPDDGGYRPRDCKWPSDCPDRRDHLGEASGVEVLVLRNPKAGITNFEDRPEGLRIYDVPDDGPGPGAAFFGNPFTYGTRVTEAHEAVLNDRRVADCILAEMEQPGTCHIPRYQTPLVRCAGTGGGGVPLLAD